MKTLDKEELRKRCQEGDLNDVLRLSESYKIEDGKLKFLRNGVDIYDIPTNHVDVEMANKVDHDPVVSPIDTEDAGKLKYNKVLHGRSQ